MLFNNTHIASTAQPVIVKSLKWNDEGYWTNNKSIGGAFVDIKVVNDVAFDLFKARQGYEAWIKDETTGKNKPSQVLASLTDPMPERPSPKHYGIYAVPVWSPEFGGINCREMVLRGQGATQAFVDLLNLFGEEMKKMQTDGSDLLIPWITLGSQMSENFSMVPTFTLNGELSKRPPMAGPPIVIFK